ncbi:MAG: C_GCAxxG_C_C family protein [Lachnospiraceae bacterium]|nr:C_GCAxxG_C_C family protein [Lachnospiraceae bacterium]
MSREQKARQTHKNGYSCASSVYSAFSDVADGTAPIPKSEGGKCGAVLSAEKILRGLGLSTDDFDRKFIARYGSLKCSDLVRSRDHSCNDLVGTAAAFVEEMI